VSSTSPDQHEQFYVVGGNLHPDAPSYVPRQADDDLYDALSRGEFCYILTSRQMGKSSLIVRTGMRLARDGVHVVTLDLTGIGQNLTPEQWCSGLLLNIGDRLDLEDELDDFWEEHEQLSPVQRLVEALRRVVLPGVEGRVVLFFDEIDVAQSLPFSANEFFAAIRHCYTRRVEDADFERLSFCLAGVATPSDLIDDPLTTPFNIGTRIELADFSVDEAARLAEGLGRDRAVAATLIGRVLHWTNGHPYLTQRMCQAVQVDPNVQTAADVDRLCEELFFSERARDQDPNLQFVRNQMLWRDLDHAALLGIYGDVVRGKNVANDETNPLISVLRLAGIVSVDEGGLGRRNTIYGRAFDKQWIRENMPDAELRRQRAAALKAMFRTAAVGAMVLLVVGLLAVVAVRQSKAARETSARAQIERGVQLLETDDAMGLLYLVEAAKVAPEDSSIRVSASRLWAGWHQVYAGRLIGVTEGVGAWSLAFTADGSQMVAGSVTGDPVGIWDVTTFTKTGIVLDHGAGVYGVATSPDGALAATAGVDHFARLWLLATGAPVGPALAHAGAVNAVAFSPDGRYLATASDDRTARVWAIATGQAITPPLKHNWLIYDIDFSPDGSLVATASGDATVGVWSVATGLPLYDGLRHGDQAQGVAFSPDGVSLATTSDDAKLRLWDVATGTLIAGPAAYEAGLVRVRYSPDGMLLLTGSSASTAQMWNAKTLQRVGRPLPHLDPVQGIDFSVDGSTVATASGDGSLRLWNVGSSAWRSRHLGHPGRVGVAAYSPDGEIVVTGGSDKTVRVWDALSASATGDPLHLDDFPRYLVFSPDGDLLVTGTSSTLRFWGGRRLNTPNWQGGSTNASGTWRTVPQAST
jgi:WD40 repeat protein